MSAAYSIPDGLRVYAIGDVHGHVGALEQMHEEISMDLLREPPENVHIVYIGDYIDRGPDSKAVIDLLIERRDRGDGIEKTFLMGNHEQTMLMFLNEDDPGIGASWFKWGGLETLASYGIKFESEVLLPAEIERARGQLQEKVPENQRAFLSDLDHSVEIGGYVFVHAGIDPEKPLEEQNANLVMSIREPFLSWDKPLEKRVVHGHTISKEPEVLAHRIGIDTGIYEGGPLTCAVLEKSDVRFLQVAA